MENKEIYDLVVVGAGPAGLTAAIYAARANLKVLVLEKSGVGSLLMAHKVDNYPGFDNSPTGYEIYSKMKNQALKFGAKIIEAVFLEVDFSTGNKIVKTDKSNFITKTLIIATGVSKLSEKKFPGETEFLGKGVSYCAHCDGAFFKNMPVTVLGNGDEVAEEAIFLTRFASIVNIVSNTNFKCNDELKKILTENEKVKFYENYELKSINGNEFVENIKILNKLNNEELTLNTAAAFLYLGTKNNFEMYSMFANVDEHGYIITDENMKTLEEGIFAAGDVRKKGLRQITTAVSDGTIAAIEAIKYINSNKN